MFQDAVAFGAPGTTPHWAHGNKDGVGTAAANSSKVWFTIRRGLLTEVYYPTVDRPQMRDLYFLIAGDGTLDREVDLDCETERLADSQGYTVRKRTRDGRYQFEKEIICDPEQACILQRTRFSGDLSKLKCYVICNPRIDGGGYGNNGETLYSGDRCLMAASKNDLWLIVASEPGFIRTSCGYSGRSDGDTDVTLHGQMEWVFKRANNGNVALTGELDLASTPEFTIVIAFGETLHSAITAGLRALNTPFDATRKQFVEGWSSKSSLRPRTDGLTSDSGALFRSSCNVLITHRDKTYLGAIVASLAIPFGDARTDPEGKGGYHLVWPRDMVNCTTALLHAGDPETPLQSLIYLTVAQRADGAFAQNFWMNGEPFWSGMQLDEVTYPILLAHRLRRHDGLYTFDPTRMALRAAEYIIHQGPITPQERWEQMSGYSPSALAVVIAALICAASFAKNAGKKFAATFLTEYADYLYLHLNEWTVTNRGELYPGIKRYFVRINPAKPGDGMLRSPDETTVHIPDHPEGEPSDFPTRNVVDAGFLELVRYGILRADDPVVVDSLQVIDHVLKIETPFGPCWRRFNHDGYGPRDDGSPYDGWGRGRAWPLLTGERGHYELAAGRDATPYLHAMERLATKTCLIAEQVWDESIYLDGRQMFGRPVDSAAPLAWAHAEYIKLALSITHGRVLDCVPEVADRYLHNPPVTAPDMWTFHYPASTMTAGHRLRVYARKRFRLRYSLDNWTQTADAESQSTEIEAHYFDIDVSREQRAPVRFTFYWLDDSRWQGCDYAVEVRSAG